MTCIDTIQLDIAADALQKAEDGLDDLPLTPRVRELQEWRLALVTVLCGVLRDVPRMTDKQREAIIAKVDALVVEVAEVRCELLMGEQDTLPPPSR